MEFLEWAYTDNFETFDEWFCLVKENEEVFPRNKIPFKEWVSEYIEKIEIRNEEEVKELLRILLSPYTRKLDKSDYESYKKMCDINGNDKNSDIYKYYIESHLKIEKNIRVINEQDAWEGLTWVLQLLPFEPYKAISALNSYLSAEIMYMPDDRITGIEQCISIIEAKFINTNTGLQKYITDLKPREFELLIASLYENLGYEVQVTPATRDGGKDIVARIKREDGSEVVYVECKLYKTTALTISTVREFFGVISYEHINRGVIFCTGYVNERLKNQYPLIQIWTVEEIITLLNAHLGSDWFKRLHLLINIQRNKQK